MYSELVETWKRELENSALQELPSEFYSRITDYFRRLRDEGRMLDKRTAKSNLLRGELLNARRMTMELVQARNRKVICSIMKNQDLPNEITQEEKEIYSKLIPAFETIQDFANSIIRGKNATETSAGKTHATTVLRFTGDVPSIVGLDMKMYGPFKAEDVASLPSDNAKVLIKQGIAEKINVA